MLAYEVDSFSFDSLSTCTYFGDKEKLSLGQFNFIRGEDELRSFIASVSLLGTLP